MRNRLAIFTFHRVLETEDPFRPGDPTADTFESICRWVSAYFRAFPLTEAVRHLAEGTLPPRAVVLTFDDGYADNALLAAPLLERFGLKATFFVASGFLDTGEVMFNDRIIEALRRSPAGRADLSAIGLGMRDIGSLQQRLALMPELLQALKHLQPDERTRRVESLCSALRAPLTPSLMMTADQVASLTRRGMEVGGHTVTHPVLTAVDLETASREIAEGRNRLQNITQTPVGAFAYPNGRPARDYAAEHVLAVRQAGFRCAVTTAWGCARSDDDPYQLPRMTIWDHRALAAVPRVLGNYFFGARGTRVARET